MPNIKRLEHKGVHFLARQGTSDEKTFDEVIVGNTYQKKGFKLKEGEHWIDLGGNVGAFALQAISKGCTVDIYEPDPFNCKMIEKNLKLNSYDANIHQKAVVAGELKKMTMYVGNNMQTWRNSLYKNWGNQKFTVECVHFSEVIKPEHCVKMDIEGAEMDILEGMAVFPYKMVAEWSLDIDSSLNRYRAILDKLKAQYQEVYHNKGFYEMPDSHLPNHIFPACDNFYCL